MAPTPTFTPTFAINEHEVDISGLERVARASANELAYEGSLAVRSERLLGIGLATEVTILAEGDSWFNLPDISGLVPNTLIDLLALKSPINNIAHWGDTLLQIVLAAEYNAHLSSGKIKHFLVSAGGNDALGGGISKYIRQRVSGQDLTNAALYVRPSYYKMAADLEGVYRGFLTAVSKLSPGTEVIVHGYDYCLPRREGQWLGEPLAFRGFDPVFQREFQRAIVRLLVDDLNIRLKRIAGALPNVRYVNLRGTLGENDWWDELHANEGGAQKLAARFEPLLPGIARTNRARESGGTEKGHAEKTRLGEADGASGKSVNIAEKSAPSLMSAAGGITRSSVDEADAVGVSRWFVSALHILTTMVTRNSICWRSECRATPVYHRLEIACRGALQDNTGVDDRAVALHSLKGVAERL